MPITPGGNYTADQTIGSGNEKLNGDTSDNNVQQTQLTPSGDDISSANINPTPIQTT